MDRAAAFGNASDASAGPLRNARHGQVGLAVPAGFCRIACPCGAAVWRTSSGRAAIVVPLRRNTVAVFHCAPVPHSSKEIFVQSCARAR